MNVFPVPLGERCMHEFVASARSLMRAWVRDGHAKRLLDYHYHAPTVYFYRPAWEAMMIEPIETESRETLEAFVAALRAIAAEDPTTLHDAPLTTPVCRPDESHAARTPILRWMPERSAVGSSS